MEHCSGAKWYRKMFWRTVGLRPILWEEQGGNLIPGENYLDLGIDTTQTTWGVAVLGRR